MKKEYRNAARTKKMIRNAFTELLGEKKSMETITATELAEKADISKSTFYNHYENIYEVFEEFENEIIEELSKVLDEIERDQATEYDAYIKKVMDFLKGKEDLYRKVIFSPDIKFFIDKLKVTISKKVFAESVVLPFSSNKAVRYVQIRFLTNACVDTVVDYFKGLFDMTLDEVGEIIIRFLEESKVKVVQ